MVLLKNLEEEMEEKRVKEKARIEEENKAKEEAAGMEKLDVMKMVERAMKRCFGGALSSRSRRPVAGSPVVSRAHGVASGAGVSGYVRSGSHRAGSRSQFFHGAVRDAGHMPQPISNRCTPMCTTVREPVASLTMRSAQH
ncbi:unnamed protein product [Gadus morhua 'NCC']